MYRLNVCGIAKVLKTALLTYAATSPD